MATVDRYGTVSGPPRVKPVEAAFACGCAASNVEWVREEHNPNAYEHMPLIESGTRLCPIHRRPLEDDQ